MDWCKKCCPLSFCQQQEVRSVKYDEPSHHFEKTVFKFPQTMESRPPFPPMFQGRQATKRLNSPHVKKMSQIVLDQPRLPLESRFISRQRYVMEPLLPLEDKLLSWQSTRRQSQNDSVEGILESPVYAKTVAQFTGNKLSSQHRIDLSSFGCRKPSLQFSLEYDMVHSVLSVHLMAAFNLPAMDICGTSDPYVEITLYPNHDKAKSKIIEKCLDPNFDEKFTFKNVYQCDINNMILQFFVYDFDKLTKDDKIGSVSVTLEEANLAGELMLYEIDMHTKAKKVNPVVNNMTNMLT